MTISLRPFLPDDVPVLENWVEQGEIRKYMSRWVPLTFADGEWNRELVRWHVIQADGDDAGTIWLEKEANEDDRAELRMLMAGEHFRGQGFGTEAILQAEQDAVDNWDVSSIFLRVRMNNRRAICCYQRVGFAVTEETSREEDGVVIPILVMEHRLS